MHGILQQLSQLRKGKQPATDQGQVDIITNGTSIPQTIIATQPPLAHAERIGGPLMQARNLRLDFPIFHGDNPKGWIFRCEQYRRLAGLSDAELLSLAIGHLDGDVVPWFHWVKQTLGEMTWAQFKRALTTRFGTSKSMMQLVVLPSSVKQGLLLTINDNLKGWLTELAI